MLACGQQSLYVQSMNWDVSAETRNLQTLGLVKANHSAMARLTMRAAVLRSVYMVTILILSRHPPAWSHTPKRGISRSHGHV